jgi:hypothetical protein
LPQGFLFHGSAFARMPASTEGVALPNMSIAFSFEALYMAPAGVVARGVSRLVGAFVFFVYDDEPQVAGRGEYRAAGSDYHAGPPERIRRHSPSF